MVFQFVENGNRDPATRKLIRSHVMKGKNTGKTRLRSAREPDDESFSFTSKLLLNGKNHGISAKNATTPAPPPGNTFSYFEFAWDVEPSMIDLVHQFVHKSLQAVYPNQFCKPLDDGARKNYWFQCMLTDKAFFYSVLSMSEVCRDTSLGKQETSPRALSYLSKTYRSIAQNIQNGGATNSTVAAVMSMALHEDFRGHPDRSKIHIDALERLIELRGGVDALKAVGLVQKICRADIEFALHNGSRPRFYRDAFPRQTLQTLLNLSTNATNCSLSESSICHNDIAGIVRDMLLVANVLNNSSTFKLEPDAYQEILISVCYRLLHVCSLSEDQPSTQQETLFYLGLLALLTTMLFQHGRSQRLSYGLLTKLIRNSLRDKRDLPLVESCAHLWLLFISGISVLGAEDRSWLVPQIKISLRTLDLSSWEDALIIIKQFPWISLLHDEPGEKLWKEVVWQ